LAEQFTQQQPSADWQPLALNFDLPSNQLPFVEVAAASLRQLGQAIADEET